MLFIRVCARAREPNLGFRSHVSHQPGESGRFDALHPNNSKALKTALPIQRTDRVISPTERSAAVSISPPKKF